MAVTDSELLGAVEAAYRQHFEVAPARASVSFLGVEAIEVLRYADGERDHYLSLGMSRYPMTDPAATIVDEAVGPRAELSVTAVGLVEGLWRNLAILAAAPAVEGAVYAVGNRIDIGQPLCTGSRCTGGVISAGPLHPIPMAEVSDVEVLQLLPATATELAWARVHGSDELRRLWDEAGTNLIDLGRDAVPLS
ncbi:MAG: Suppressor of fused protein [Frankiales bacterium]|nr:Suppressor of fused protein [Frankiales bacterium]